MQLLHHRFKVFPIAQPVFPIKIGYETCQSSTRVLSEFYYECSLFIYIAQSHLIHLQPLKFWLIGGHQNSIMSGDWGVILYSPYRIEVTYT